MKSTNPTDRVKFEAGPPHETKGADPCRDVYVGEDKPHAAADKFRPVDFLFRTADGTPV